jgi:sulfate transport system permease protein
MGGLLKRKGILPGFGLSLGISTAYLGLVVLIPLSMLFLKTADLSWAEFWGVISAPRVTAAFRLTFLASAAAAALNTVFGLIVAWVLARYSFPGKRFVDGIVDVPFALPTAVAGIALTAVYAPTGFLGRPLAALGVAPVYSATGVVIALTFIGLPFVVRTLQPVIEDADRDMEEASVTLGASRAQILRRVLLPPLIPALLTGFGLSFARAVGEYGSVVFISGNMPFRTEIAPLLIMTKLEQFDYPGAAAIASLLLVSSFSILLTVNLLQRWTRRRLGEV